MAYTLHLTIRQSTAIGSANAHPGRPKNKGGDREKRSQTPDIPVYFDSSKVFGGLGNTDLHLPALA